MFTATCYHLECTTFTAFQLKAFLKQITQIVLQFILCKKGLILISFSRNQKAGTANLQPTPPPDQ